MRKLQLLLLMCLLLVVSAVTAQEAPCARTLTDSSNAVFPTATVLIAETTTVTTQIADTDLASLTACRTSLNEICTLGNCMGGI